MDVKIHESLHSDHEALATAHLIEKCVHCGFCLPACPTYELEQDERDSPRGRIFLVKELLEGTGNAAVAQTHLERCLTCRSCETVCPSGVEYSRIANYGRQAVGEDAPLSLSERLLRKLLAYLLRAKLVMQFVRKLATALSVVLPTPLRRVFPQASPPRQLATSTASVPEQVILFSGCGPQCGLMPETNTALAKLLTCAGYSVETVTGNCCGALAFHLGLHAQAYTDINKVVAKFTPARGHQLPPLVVAASGCASFMREYPDLGGLEVPARTAARKLADAIVDPAVLLGSRVSQLHANLGDIGQQRRVAVHAPCTQTNGLRTPPTAVDELLQRTGFHTLRAAQPPSCCGSAGTYSLLHPQRARQLRTKMVDSLESCGGEIIVSANIGCILHMRPATALPVVHWADLLVAHSLE